MIDHERGGIQKILVQRWVRRGRKVRFAERLFHQLDPPIAGAFVNLKRRVAHAEARVAALLAVGRGPAEALDEEHAEAFFRAGEILLGVERAEDVVAGHAAIKRGDQATKTVVANRGIDLIFPKRCGVTAHGMHHSSELVDFFPSLRTSSSCVESSRLFRMVNLPSTSFRQRPATSCAAKAICSSIRARSTSSRAPFHALYALAHCIFSRTMNSSASGDSRRVSRIFLNWSI